MHSIFGCTNNAAYIFKAMASAVALFYFFSLVAWETRLSSLENEPLYWQLCLFSFCFVRTVVAVYACPQ